MQDRFGVDVNLLLFCVYVGVKHSLILSERDISQIYALIEPWQKNVVLPFRTIRKTMKLMRTHFGEHLSVTIETLRTKIKTLEIESEHIEQTMLSDWLALRASEVPSEQNPDAVGLNIRRLLAMYSKGRWNEEDYLPISLIKAAADTL